MFEQKVIYMITKGVNLNKMKPKQSIGENVRDYRKKRGLEQRELALITELSGPTISNIERNVKMPSIKTLAKIARVLHCSVSDLMQDAVEVN